MASVSLHPLASRSGAQSATVVSIQLPNCNGFEPDSSALKDSTGDCLDEEQHQHHHNAFASSATAQAISPSPFLDSASPSFPQSPSHNRHNEAGAVEEDDGESAYEESEERPAQFWQDEVEGLEWGLHHADLDQYPVLLTGEDEEGQDAMPPIRVMTAKQYATLQRQYADIDVPHSVMFPFLHGVDGDNPAQNAFFRAPLSGMPTPLYRGLTLVRADMPTPEQESAMSRKRASSSASKISRMTGSRSRADSLATTDSTFSNDSSSSSEEDDSVADLPRRASGPMAASKSTTSVSSLMTSSDHSRSSSLFSRAMSSDTTASSVCIDSDSYKASEAAAFHAQASRQRLAHNHHHHRRSPVHEPQPAHSMLNSTMMPHEILNPPLMANLSHNTLEPARQSCLPGDNLRCVHGATFVQAKQANGISLRNFRTQCTKYATISDLVLYCPTGLHPGLVTLAQWARDAQETCFRERVVRGLGGLRYNTFVITEPFESFEREQPHLIAVDAGGFSRNRVDFIEREREEMQRFTEATEIDDNVWMGCTANVPYSSDEFEGSSLSLDSYLPQEVNPHAFSICIEAMEQVEMPTQSRLSHAAHYLDALEATAMFEVNSKEALRELEEDESDGFEEDRPSLGPSGWSPSSRSKRGSYRRSVPAIRQQKFYPPPSNIIHFKTIGSGSCFEDDSAEEEALERIVDMCIWIKKQSCPTAVKPSHVHGGKLHGALRYKTSWPKAQQQFPRRVLLHCSDGYTDTSILGLAYLMYSRQLSLPEAYLDLQNRCNRCFFVYGRDIPFLQRLSHRLAVESKALYGAPERVRGSFNCWNSSNDDISSQRNGIRRSSSARRHSIDEGSTVEQSVWARGLAAATGLVTQGPGSKRSNNNLRNSVPTSVDMARTNTPTPRKGTPTPHSPERETSSSKVATTNHSWFTNPNFQGSFPSKILPFLFLGNLSHALNPAMLHAIGITHVVSVGESALVPPDVGESVYGAASAVTCGATIKHQRKKSKGSSSGGDSERIESLWEEERLGRISVLDLKNVSDDGIDSLRPHMRRAIEYIEQARKDGGKVLVHCRVGVSRSATICIAYVMAHCDLSMVESFLLVRSRRMNVLTQPTLLFVWELRGFEAQLARIKEKRGRREEGGGDLIMHDATTAPLSSLPNLHQQEGGFSLAGLSISSSDSLASQGSHQGCCHMQQDSSVDEKHNELYTAGDDNIRVDVGAGAGSVYGFEVKDTLSRPFNSGSLTRLDYYSAKLTHGYFCKLLSELNARYMVA